MIGSIVFFHFLFSFFVLYSYDGFYVSRLLFMGVERGDELEAKLAFVFHLVKDVGAKLSFGQDFRHFDFREINAEIHDAAPDVIDFIVGIEEEAVVEGRDHGERTFGAENDGLLHLDMEGINGFGKDLERTSVEFFLLETVEG